MISCNIYVILLITMISKNNVTNRIQPQMYQLTVLLYLYSYQNLILILNIIIKIFSPKLKYSHCINNKVM